MKNHSLLKRIQKDKIDAFQLFSFFCVVSALIGAGIFMNARVDYLTNSDDASELVLSRLLASEKKLLSPNWYYSTELRVLNTQIIYAFFFMFINDWHVVKVLSNICMYFILLFSYNLLCKGLGCKKYPITAVLLFCPFSEFIFECIIRGAYYIPHIVICFLTLALAEIYMKSTGWNSKICFSVSAVLSLIAGLGGARQISILYLPLLTAAGAIRILKQKDNSAKKYNLLAITTFCGAMIGYVINTKVLAKIYHFQIWDNISFSSFDISRFTTVLNGFLRSYGFSTGKVFSISVLTQNVMCAIWIIATICSIFYAFKKWESVSESFFRLAAFAASSFVIHVLLYLFTDMPYAERYNLPVIMLSIPLLEAAAEQIRPVRKRLWVRANLFLFVILVGLNSIFFLHKKADVDNTLAYREISDILLSQNYCNGYATFWNANVLTELSDGNIDVWCWCDNDMELSSLGDINHTYKWLQSAEHDNTHPSGKIFLLLSENQYLNNNWNLSTGDILYHSNGFIVLGYEGYDSLISEITKGES